MLLLSAASQCFDIGRKMTRMEKQLLSASQQLLSALSASQQLLSALSASQ